MPCDDCRAREAENERLRSVLNEADDVLTEAGWHTDRGLLSRIRAALAPVDAEAVPSLRGPCIYPGCTDDAKRIYAVCYTHRNKPYLDARVNAPALPASAEGYCLCPQGKTISPSCPVHAPVDAPPVRVVRSKEWWMEKARAEEGTPAAGMLARDPVDAPAVEKPHPFTPCEKGNAGLPGHNFTCAILCDICGLPERKHAPAPAKGKETPRE